MHKPEKMKYRTDKEEVFKHLDYPLNVGGSLTISSNDEDDKEHHGKILNISTIKIGLQVMAVKYPRHWQDFIQENADACTADVFLQCCLFGEVIFG
jgi:hypothetical protein